MLLMGVSRHLQVLKSGETSSKVAGDAMKQIGEAIAKLHDGGLVHGDLTTSNMLLRQGDGKLALIDFGLSFNSTNPEDKAVDLYVCERALASAHSDREGLFKVVLETYRKASKHHSAVFNRFAEVRMRGRKRTMVG
jgi:TP53 regulating kinase and related kinases